MTKRDLAGKVAEKIRVTQFLTLKVIDSVLNEITDALANGGKIELRDFGVFKIKKRRERLGRNPRTGEEVPIPSRKVVYFKPGKLLKEKVTK